ncbi:MAG: peptidoglycan DD-metalloendopeptidase family protein [Bacteroidota bacterium]
MILYLLKSTLCLILLIGVYRFILAPAGTFLFNRFFLLFAICFSLTIPLIEIDSLKTAIPDKTPVYSAFTEIEDQIVDFEEQEINTPVLSTNARSNVKVTTLLLSFYLLIALILVLRYILNIRKLIRVNRFSQTIYHQGIKLILLDDKVAPHSFLDCIFICKEDYEKGVSDELLTHELAHIKQRHTWDILFVELVKIIFWFNPILQIYAKSIRVNHEYLADRTVIENHQDIKSYQLQLIQYLSKFHSTAFTSHLNYSITKKRFEMMKKKISKTVAVISITVMIPILFFALMAFSPTIRKIEQSIEKEASRLETFIEMEVFEGENSIPTISPIERPAIHRVSSGFGQRMNPVTKKQQMHFGVDLTADTGVKVLATADGKVSVAEYKSGWGNHVKVDHGNGYETFYAHMHELKVLTGQNLKKGDVIGTVGNTGKSNGPHLHYEVIEEGKHVDPISFISDIHTDIGQEQGGTSNSSKNWASYTRDGKTYRVNNVKRTVIGSKEDSIGLIMYNDSIVVVAYKHHKTFTRTFDELTELEKEMLNAPPKKPKRVSPTQKQLDDWLDPKVYGVWLDGKRISNERLKEYQPDDFSNVFISKLAKNAKNYGKHEFQIGLRTNESFEKRWQEQLKAWEEQGKL